MTSISNFNFNFNTSTRSKNEEKEELTVCILSLENLPNDCLVRIMAFSGNPLLARISKKIYRATFWAYQEIYDSLKSDSRLFMFKPSEGIHPNYGEMIKHIYLNQMKSAKSPHIQNSVRKLTPSPLSLIRQIKEIEEDANLVECFPRFIKALRRIDGQIEMPNLIDDADAIRKWLSENQKVTNEITALDLSELNLSGIPKEVFDLANLEMLLLNGNELEETPPGIEKLKKLKWVEYDTNHPISKLLKETGS